MARVPDVDEPKARAFLSAMRNEALNLTCNPTTTELVNADYIMEVERIVSGGLSHARYFLPTNDGKYVEVHVKDSFSGTNPMTIYDPTFSYISMGCGNPAHAPPNGILIRHFWVMENPLRGQRLERPMRLVNGKWLISGEVPNWGT
jgi:hypothetical protein